MASWAVAWSEPVSATRTSTISRRNTPEYDLSQPNVRAVVRPTAARAAETTDDDDFEKVSSHSHRRRFAQRSLVDRQLILPAVPN